VKIERDMGFFCDFWFLRKKKLDEIGVCKKKIEKVMFGERVRMQRWKKWYHRMQRDGTSIWVVVSSRLGTY
jgi:hypothetical protein